MNEAFLLAHAGESLFYKITITGPDSNPVPYNSSYLSTNLGYTVNVSGYLNKQPSSFVNLDYQTSKLNIPADPTGYSGSYTPSVYVSAKNFATGGTLLAGEYTLDFALLAGNTEIRQASGLTVSNLRNSYTVPGGEIDVPSDATSSSLAGTLCIDPAKVAVGDVIKAELYVDDTKSNNTDAYWKTKSTYKSQSDVGYRAGSYASSVTVTQYDLDYGLAADVRSYYNSMSLAPGSTHSLDFKFFNSATDADVSGTCAPAKPAAPSVVLNNNAINVTATLSSGSASYGSYCFAYDKATPNVVFSSTRGFTGMPGSPAVTCSIGSLQTGHTYFVKFQTSFGETFSPLSDASADLLVPAGGYTITTSYAGVLGAGKVMKVSDNNIPIESFSSSMFSTPTYSDGNGGLYTFGSANSCNPMCSPGQVRIRHIKNDKTLDTSFGGTGSIVISSFAAGSLSSSSFGYYGAGKDKWVIPVSGQNGSDPQVQMIFGNSADSNTTSKILSKSNLDAVCSSAASGYTIARPTYLPQVSILSAPTANPFISITCYKEYTLGDSSKQWLSLNALATIDPATGALTLKGTFGTPSDSANGFSYARVSVNPAATGNEPMFTVLVGAYKYTATANNQATGTVADHLIIRISSNGTFLSTTTSGWGTSGGPANQDYTPSVASINAGKLYGIGQSGPSQGLITIDTTGVATSTTIDTTASSVMMPSVSLPAGYPIASNETLIPVSVRGMNEIAAGWINSSTGVLTTGEKLAYTSSPSNGMAQVWLNGNDKNTYLLISAAAAPENLTVLKWIDSRYTVPTGPVPTVTSKDVKYSKNTPAAGTKVTLTGTNLNVVTSATIGGNAAALGTKSATSLQLTLPTASSAGTVDIVLTTADGPRTVDTFTYVGTGVQQNVTVTALSPSVAVGTADLALAATVSFSPNDAGTAGAITWSSDTPTVCSIVSGKAHLLTAGTCTVKATAAESGLLLSGNATAATTVSAGTQTVTVTGSLNAEVDLDGIDLVASTTSGLQLTFATSTPAVCSVDVAAHVTAITPGSCVVTASQAGNSSYLAADASVTIIFAAAATTPVVDNGNPAQPTVVDKTGVYVQNGDTSLSWNRAKGVLNFKINVVYIGPIKATGVFKVGSKTYTCSMNFGILKKQATNKRLVLTSPNLCSGSKEKVQLAALKAAPANTVVKVTFVRDMRLPTTYAKIRTKTRVIYAKLG